MSAIHLSIVIPAYNEEKRITDCIDTIAAYLSEQHYVSEIIAVDDGSADATLTVLQSLQTQHSIVKVLSYAENHGKGYAVRQGVLAAEGNYVLFSDADLNVPIEEITKLFAALREGAQIAIGSRAAEGAVVAGRRPRLREIGSRCLNLAIRMLAVPGIRDTQCGFKLFGTNTAKDLFRRSFMDGFSFDVEILYLARKLGYRVEEVPVTWIFRGGSKVRPVRDGLLFLRDILRMRLHNYRLSAAAETAK